MSAEEVDNDRGRFWRHVATALGVDRTKQRLRGGEPFEGDRWIDLLVRDAASNWPRVLIVDNFHLITDATIVESVARFVDQLPSPLRLVLVGQKAPAFSLQRLLSTGEATALCYEDLRFTVEESAALIALSASQFMPVEDLRVLTERSEGWAAGLHLAARALAGHRDPSGFVRRFSGAFGPVADYLEHEIFLCRSPDLVRFLLQTSVLECLTADLCRAVSGRGDAGEIIDWLADHNLFVFPIDSSEGTYRYHRLVADVLRSRLEREDSSLARHAHLGAAACFEQRGDVRSAAHHFAQAQAYDQAFALVFSDLVQALDAGPSVEATQLPVPGLPETSVGEDPGRMFILAAAWLIGRQVVPASAMLRRVDAATTNDPYRHLWQGRAEFLWALHADRICDPSGVIDHCRAAVDLMVPTPEAVTGRCPTIEPQSAWLHPIDRAIAARLPVLAARAHAWVGQPDDAGAILTDHFGSRDAAEASQPATVAMMACRQGRLKDAYRLATVALQRAEGYGGTNELHTLDARVVLADVLFEQNVLNAAYEQLEAALEFCRARAVTSWLWAVHIELVRVMMARRRPDDALNRLGHLRQVEARNLPPYQLMQKLNEVDIACRMALGDLEGALLVARSIPSRDLSTETLARIDLHSGRPDRAVARLSAGRAPALAAEIRRLVLLTCAHLQQGRPHRANETLRLAVEAGRPGLFIRPFLEEAPQTFPLLHGIRAATSPDPYLTQLVTEAQQLCPTLASTGSTAMLEPLTRRERQILGRLPCHLSQNQIGAEMYIAPSTVKTHLKALYRKLNATSRSEAVDIARAHGLL
jgi:LuxR family maltose regulon positive regulatory protein